MLNLTLTEYPWTDIRSEEERRQAEYEFRLDEVQRHRGNQVATIPFSSSINITKQGQRNDLCQIKPLSQSASATNFSPISIPLGRDFLQFAKGTVDQFSLNINTSGVAQRLVYQYGGGAVNPLDLQQNFEIPVYLNVYVSDQEYSINCYDSVAGGPLQAGDVLQIMQVPIGTLEVTFIGFNIQYFYGVCFKSFKGNCNILDTVDTRATQPVQAPDVLFYPNVDFCIDEKKISLQALNRLLDGEYCVAYADHMLDVSGLNLDQQSLFNAMFTSQNVNTAPHFQFQSQLLFLIRGILTDVEGQFVI